MTPQNTNKEIIIKLNEGMIINVFLNIEILLNDKITEISEYDVQSFIFIYFRRCLLSFPNFYAARESAGKVDCVLYENNKPKVYYELKTFYKNNEYIKSKIIKADIEKLTRLIREKTESVGYLIISGSRKKLKSVLIKNSDKDLDFIRSHFSGSRKWIDFQLDDGTKIKLRPSVKQLYGYSRGFLASWEIKI